MGRARESLETEEGEMGRKVLWERVGRKNYKRPVRNGEWDQGKEKQKIWRKNLRRIKR